MKFTIVMQQIYWLQITNHVLQDEQERMSFAYCGLSILEQEQQFLVKTIDLPGRAEYREQGTTKVSLKAERAVSRIVQAKEYQAFIDCHSHPFAAYPSPSAVDREGWQRQLKVFQDLAPQTRLITLVISKSRQVWAAVYEQEEWKPIAKIILLGEQKREVIIPVNSTYLPKDGIQPIDRRTQAVLGDVYHQLRLLKVLIIGVGGVGSAVVAQLRGYVNHLILIDPDTVEIHNAPRLYGYQDGDVGSKKVNVLARLVQQGFPTIHLKTFSEAFPSATTLQAFKEADIIFCCPDHNAVRYAVAQVANRYLKPLIEVGCGGRRTNNGQITALGYHVRLQVPGSPCLACNGMDLRDLEDPSTTAMKRQIGYVEDGELIQGELMSLTTRAAADAVDLFFRYITGYASGVSHLYFDALQWQTLDLTSAYHSHPNCPLCSHTEASLLAAGDFLTQEQQILSPQLTGGA